MKSKTTAVMASGVAAVGLTAAALLATSTSAVAETPTPTPTTSASANPGTTPATTPSGSTSPSSGSSTKPDRGQSSDTAVTGDEAAKVIAAVKTKDSAATITTVRKDPDGSYDALGTKNSANVFYDVSADLTTITENTGGGRGGKGGSSTDTVVTGDDAAKVIAAVKTKDSAATITTVRKDPDGSYDALGTKNSANVFYDVSADLKTITENTGGGRK